MSRQRETPLTRADLERIAEAWGVRIDDLWPALDAARRDDVEILDQLEEIA